MSKLRVLSGSEVCRILEKNGFVLVAATRQPYNYAAKSRRNHHNYTRSKSFRNKNRNFTFNHKAKPFAP